MEICQLSTRIEELCFLLNWLTSLLFHFIILRYVDMTSSCSLTMSCVKVEMSTVELSGFLITRRPSLGWRIKVNVMTRLEVLLMSFVTTCKSSFVMGVEEPGGKTRNWIKKNYRWSGLDNPAWNCLCQANLFFSCLVFSLAVATRLNRLCGCIKCCKFSPLEAFHIFFTPNYTKQALE